MPETAARLYGVARRARSACLIPRRACMASLCLLCGAAVERMPETAVRLYGGEFVGSGNECVGCASTFLCIHHTSPSDSPVLSMSERVGGAITQINI
jgi:ferredoxin